MNENKYLHYDLAEDFKNNCFEFFSAIKKYKNGFIIYGKWSLIYLCMILHSIFVMILGGNNNFSIIKFKTNLGSKNKYSISYDLRMQTPFRIDNAKDIFIAGYFGNEDSINALMKCIKDLSIEISLLELKSAFEKINKLISINELYLIIVKELQLTNVYNKAFYNLVQIRNDFIHFSPKYWLVQDEYISQILNSNIKLLLLILSSCKVPLNIEKEIYIKELKNWM